VAVITIEAETAAAVSGDNYATPAYPDDHDAIFAETSCPTLVIAALMGGFEAEYTEQELADAYNRFT